MFVWLSVWSKVQTVCIWHSPADATVIPKPHCLLPNVNPDWLYLSGTGLPKLSWERGCWMGVVVVVVHSVDGAGDIMFLGCLSLPMYVLGGILWLACFRLLVCHVYVKGRRFRDGADNITEENLSECTVAVCEGMQAVKLCFNKILWFLNGGAS